MASSFAAKNDKIKGVSFYASYPSGDELKNKGIKALSIYGSNDGVADIQKIKDAHLPEGSNIVEIKGGNHAQFGEYGNQEGDNPATISNDDQIKEAVKYTVEMMNDL